jgi:hypothetical protein
MESAMIHRFVGRRALAQIGLALAALAPVAAQDAAPPEWRWRLDRQVSFNAAQQRTSDTAWRFVRMPPGFHVTTGPAAVLYHPAERASGRYSLQADFVLFPRPSESGYGVAFGGVDLADPAGSYLLVQLRRDGAVRVVAMDKGAERSLAPWVTHTAIKPHPGSGVVTNRLRVRVGSDSLRVFVNDSAVVAVPAAGLRTDGAFGLQWGISWICTSRFSI